MSKDGSNKNPMPDDRTQKFMSIVYMLADEYGIKDDSNLYHYVELLGDAAARQVFENNHKMSPQKKVHSDRKRFIAIFKTRYNQAFDLEYRKKILPAESKLIGQVNKELLKNQFTPDNYLAWVFEEFLPNNDNLGLPTVKSICSQWFVHTFLNENRELKESKSRQERDKKAGHDLIQRARGLRRHGLSDEDKKILKEVLTEYGEQRIMLADFRKIVEKLESKYN